MDNKYKVWSKQYSDFETLIDIFSIKIKKSLILNTTSLPLKVQYQNQLFRTQN